MDEHTTGLYQHQAYCDHCGVQAYVAYEWIDDDVALILTFCAHHGTKHGPALESRGWTKTHDDTHLINIKPISANVE